MVKAYETIWALIAVSAAAVLVTGNMTMLVAVGFGFFAFGMIFAGMMMVLPATVAHRNHPETPKVKDSKEKGFVPTSAVHAR